MSDEVKRVEFKIPVHRVLPPAERPVLEAVVHEDGIDVDGRSVDASRFAQEFEPVGAVAKEAAALLKKHAGK